MSETRPALPVQTTVPITASDGQTKMIGIGQAFHAGHAGWGHERTEGPELPDGSSDLGSTVQCLVLAASWKRERPHLSSSALRLGGGPLSAFLSDRVNRMD
jgi:hypothetical protein